MKVEARFFLVAAKHASRSSTARQLAFAALLACALLATLIAFGDRLSLCGGGCNHQRCSGCGGGGVVGLKADLRVASDPSPALSPAAFVSQPPSSATSKSQPPSPAPSVSQPPSPAPSVSQPPSPAPPVSQPSSLQRRQHALAVIVPFRDRFDDLTEFVPHIGRFLRAQGVAHHVYVVNQVDSHRFNRASLANVGFQLSGAHGSGSDYVAIHDVDLLPLSPAVRYDYPPPPAEAVHLSPAGLHPRYAYAAFFGGALLVTRAAYERINGMSNRFWGWGREDDELRARIAEAGLIVAWPTNVTSGNRTFRHSHNEARHPRDFGRRQGDGGDGTDWWTAARDNTGLSDVRYWLNSTVSLTVDGHAATLYDVTLDCQPDRTPWCDESVASATTTAETSAATIR